MNCLQAGRVRSRPTFMALGDLIHRELALVTHRGRRCKRAKRLPFAGVADFLDLKEGLLALDPVLDH